MIRPTERELTQDELLAEKGDRVRACLCASWEIAGVGRCVCPDARETVEEPLPGPPATRRDPRPGGRVLGPIPGQGTSS